MHDFCWATAVELAELVARGEVAPRAIIEAALAQIERLNEPLMAVCTRADAQALEAADRLERALARGATPGPLAGVPVLVKDLHFTKGIRTTLGSRMYADFVPDFDHPIVERLKAAGAIVVGKTNTSELGLIPLAMNSLFGDSHNPWKLSRNTGGSSGGSAAAVACGMAPLATASDGGGSIRIPASFCGVFGIKPQFGRVPHRAVPRGWESLAHQGPISRSVRDAARMLDVVAGPDLLDRRALPPPPVSYEAACSGDVRGLRLAWSADLGGLPIEAEIAELCRQAAWRFVELGAMVEEISLNLPDLGPAQQTIVLCEAATAMHERRAEWEQALFPLTGRLLPNADRKTFFDLVRAEWARDDYWERISGLFEQFDALLTPTSPIPPTDVGTLGPREIAGQKTRALAWLGLVVPFNMTGQPAATIPAGFDHQGLPVGLQLVGRRFDEPTLFRLASAYEAAYPWTTVRPPLCR